jgi:site-specific recombinase XerD
MINFMEIRKLLDQFLSYLLIEKNYSKNTLENYKIWLEKFVNWLEYFKKINDISQLEVIHLFNFREFLLQE